MKNHPADFVIPPVMGGILLSIINCVTMQYFNWINFWASFMTGLTIVALTNLIYFGGLKNANRKNTKQ